MAKVTDAEMSALTGHDIMPREWGVYHWAAFHSPALAAPDDLATNDSEQARLLAYYRNFGHGLPCHTCRGHYEEKIQQYPPPVKEGRLALIKWSFGAHNGLNKAHGKPEWAFEKALQHWTNVFNKPFLVPGYEHVVPKSPIGATTVLGVLLAAVLINRWRRAGQ